MSSTALLPPPSQKLARSVSTYDANAAYFEQRYAQADTSALRERFVQRLPASPGVIIDAGCGTGRDLAALNATGVSTVGIDLSTGLLRYARDHGPVARADMRTLPLQSDSVRGVWAMASLVHLTPLETRAALCEFERVLVPGGAAFISVMEGTTSWWLDTSHGSRWFQALTALEITALAQQVGLDIVEQEVATGSIGGRWINALLCKP